MFRKLFIICTLLLGTLGIANAQTSISASSITDSFGHPIPSAKLCYAPVDATGTATGFRVGSVQVITTPVCGLVSNGVLQSGLSVEPTPSGIYYHITVNNRTTNAVLRDYGMTQVTGSSWTLDTYDPSMSVLPVTAITVGTITTGTPGTPASCNMTGSGPVLLNCTIPQGAPGTGSIAGLTSDGSNGIDVTGAVTSTKENTVYTPPPTANLQTVITTAGANSTIQLVCGTYTVSAGLTMSSNYVHLHGVNRDCVTINFTSGSGLVNTGNNVEIDGITFSGATTNSSVNDNLGTFFRFHDNTITGSGGTLGAIHISAPTSDIWIENNIFTGNGPSTGTGGDVIQTDGSAAGYVNRLHLRKNTVISNATEGAVYLFDVINSDITDNYVDESNNTGTGGGNGYGITVYAEGGASAITSISRTSNVVTAVTTGSVWPWAVGQKILINFMQPGSASTDFNGLFTLTSVSGGTLQWAQTSPNDSVSSPAGVVGVALIGNNVTKNRILNTAGACIYMQGVANGKVSNNDVSECDLQIAVGSLPESGISLNGAVNMAVDGNLVDTVGLGSGLSLTNTSHVGISGGSISNVDMDGIRIDSSEYIKVAGVPISNAPNLAIGSSTTGITNCFKCSFVGNDITLSPSGGGYYFSGTATNISITGGSIHAPSSGLAPSAVFLGSGTGSVSVTGVAIDCAADTSTVATVNTGIQSSGTGNQIRGNTVTGCNHSSSSFGIRTEGSDDVVDGNKVTGGYYGVLTTGSTRPTFTNNQLWGNTTALYTTGSTSPVISGNKLVQTGAVDSYDSLNGYKVAGATVIPSTATGSTGTGNVALSNSPSLSSPTLSSPTLSGTANVTGVLEYYSSYDNQSVTITVGSAAGASATATCSSGWGACTPHYGTVTVTTGSSGTTTGILFTISWSSAWNHNAFGLAQEYDAVTTPLRIQPNGSSSTSVCSFSAIGTAPATSTTYQFFYHCE